MYFFLFFYISEINHIWIIYSQGRTWYKCKVRSSHKILTNLVPKGKPTTKITQGIGIGRIILQFVITNRCDLCQSVSISFMFLRSQEGVSLTHLFSAHGNSYLFWAWKRGQGSPDHFRKVAFALEPETVCEHGWHMVIWNHCNVKEQDVYSSQAFKMQPEPKKNTEHIPLKTFETY